MQDAFIISVSQMPPLTRSSVGLLLLGGSGARHGVIAAAKKACQVGGSVVG